jgi:predicted ATPase
LLVHDERCQEAELYLQSCERLLTESRDQVAAAEDRFCQASETARGQQSRAWELWATMSLARRWQRQGLRGDARATLAAVSDT